MKKKRKTYQSIFLLCLCGALCFTTGPAVYAEEFDSGNSEISAYQGSEDTENEFQDGSADKKEMPTDSFSSDETKGIFISGEEEEQQDQKQDEDQNQEQDEDIRYIKGRPLTEEEREKELEPFKYLTPMEKRPFVESNLDIDAYELYPSRYDAREKGFVTPAKNQYRAPICYAFAVTAAAETSLLAQGKGTYDLSEAHLAYFLGHRSDDPLGNTPNDRNTTSDEYAWQGNPSLAAVFLTTWSGLTTENDVPFPEDFKYSGISSEKISSEKEYHVSAYMEDAVFSDYSMNRMKELIMQYQSVEFGLTLDTGYYNADTASACNPDEVGANHSVLAVGWDDNYSAKNFAPASHVTSDGAWIVKNSWGDKWGDNGYFYLSYEDKNICDLLTLSATDNVEFKNNYFYDGSTGFNTWSLGRGQSMAVSFETKAGNGYAEILGEVNVITFTDDARYSIQVYANLTDAQSPTSGSAVYESAYEVYQPLAGIKTIKIPEIILEQKSRYSIVITNIGDNNFSIGREASASNSWYCTVAGSNNGESFFTVPGYEKWTDLVSTSSSPRIKAHTRTLDYAVSPTLSFETDKTVLKAGETAKTTATIMPESLNYINLSYESSDPNVATVDAEGVIRGKKSGTAVITCRSADSSQLLSTVAVKVKSPEISGFQAKPEAYNKVALSWNRAEDADGYIIYRMEEGKESKKLARVDADKVSFKDTSVIPGRNYVYTIVPYMLENKQEIYGNTSDSIRVRCVLNTTEFTVQALSDGYNQLKWKKVPGASAYNIFRKKPSGKWEFLRAAGLSETKYNDKNVKVGDAYQYTVQAYIEISGEKIYGGYQVSQTIKAAPALTKISSAKSEKQGIRIRWNVQKKCDGYQILRKTKNGVWKEVKKINSGTTGSWIDQTAKKGESYYYAVKAFVKQTKGNTYGKYKASSLVKRK